MIRATFPEHRLKSAPLGIKRSSACRWWRRLQPVIGVLFVLTLCAVSAQPELLRVEGSVDAMGTAFSIVAYGEDRGKLQSAVSQGLEEARLLDEMLSNYIPQSEWGMPFITWPRI